MAAVPEVPPHKLKKKKATNYGIQNANGFLFYGYNKPTESSYMYIVHFPV
jgi:hypothetical protein